MSLDLAQPAERARFHAMTDGGPEDWAIIARASKSFTGGLVDRVLAHLRMLSHDSGGFAVDRLEHSLQTATRAYRAGEDEEYVVCALLHDLGDLLGPTNHADISAAVLRPFVGDENHWMVLHHAIFQGYYFFEHFGLDRNMRDRFRGHPAFDRTVHFCDAYDQAAFDPSYDSMPLEAFEPILRRVTATVKHSIYLGADGNMVSGADCERPCGAKEERI